MTNHTDLHIADRNVWLGCFDFVSDGMDVILVLLSLELRRPRMRRSLSFSAREIGKGSSQSSLVSLHTGRFSILPNRCEASDETVTTVTTIISSD